MTQKRWMRVMVWLAACAACAGALGCDAGNAKKPCNEASVTSCRCEAGGTGQRSCEQGELGACVCVASAPSSLTGRVFDADTGLPLDKASLQTQAGDATKSDAKGRFELPASKESDAIEVSKQNYVASVERPPQKGGYMEVFIKDVEKSVDFDPEKGVKVVLDSGASIDIPAGAVRDAEGKTVTGMVTLAVADVDGEKRAHASALPDGLKAQDEKGNKGQVSVQRAMSIRITDSKGGTLQVSADEKVVAEYPAKENDSPEQSGLSYDEKKSSWVQEGKVKRSVNEKGEPVYRKDIDHLSWHGFGTFFSELSCLRVCVVDADGQRLPGAQVWLIGASFPFVASVFSGDDGCVSHDAPITQQMVLVGQTVEGVSEPAMFSTGSSEQSASEADAQCVQAQPLVIKGAKAGKCPSGFRDCGASCAESLEACDAMPATCAAPTNGPTMHSSGIGLDETWTADQSPHLIQYDTTINANVTLEPCAQVQIAPRITVTVGLNGTLTGIGTASRPIAIRERDAGQSWASLRVIGGRLSLAHTVISGGGEPFNTGLEFTGMLYGQVGSDPSAAADPFSLRQVTLSGSKSVGIVLQGARFTADSSDLTVVGSASYPVNIYPRDVGSLPNGSYVGNGRDEILLPGSGGGEDISADTTFYDRGVPYHVGATGSLGQLRVGTTPGSPLATLTIEPGVVLRFQKDGIFEIEHFTGDSAASGALVARGTADKPIVFTSAESTPSASDWIGLTYGSLLSPSNALDHVRVEYAGLPAGSGFSCLDFSNKGAIKILAQPANAFITNTTIAHSLNDGITSSWRGTPVDFITSNTFEDIAGCKVTNPQDASGSCQDRALCAL